MGRRRMGPWFPRGQPTTMCPASIQSPGTPAASRSGGSPPYHAQLVRHAPIPGRGLPAGSSAWPGRSNPRAEALTPRGKRSRYAGAMLLHAFGARAGAGDILAAAAGDSGPGGTRFADVALLSATSIGFALGAATTG